MGQTNRSFIDSPASAAAFFDASFTQPDAVEQLRALLAQARNVPAATAIELDPRLRERCETHHRIAPLVERGWPTVDRDERRGLALQQLRLRSVAAEVAGCLRSAGVESRSLKGMATAALDYPNRALRPTADVDVLVRFDDVPRSVEALVRIGCVPRPVERMPPMLQKGPVLVHPSGFEIDLHFRLSVIAPRSDDPLLFDDGEPVEGGLVALPTELRLVHAAMHSVVSVSAHRRLSSVADVVAIIDNTGVDWDRARHAADRLGLTQFAREGLRLEALLMDRGGHAGLDWPTLPRWKAAAILSNRINAPQRHLMAFSSLRSVRDRAVYARCALLPEPASLAERGGIRGHVRHMWHGVRA